MVRLPVGSPSGCDRSSLCLINDRWNRLPDELCASLSECFTPEAKAKSNLWTFSEQVADLFHLVEEKKETFELRV